MKSLNLNFQKRHYTWIAERLASFPFEDTRIHYALASHFAVELEKSNENFNSEKFLNTAFYTPIGRDHEKRT